MIQMDGMIYVVIQEIILEHIMLIVLFHLIFFFPRKWNEVRNKMLNGEKVDVCQRCYEQEEFIGDSKRIEYIDTYGTPKK